MASLKFLLCFLLLISISVSSHATRSSPDSIPVQNKAKQRESMMESAKSVLNESLRRQIGKPYKPKRLSPGGPDPRHH